MNFQAVWVTVNRGCNLRCEWCYASKFFDQSTRLKDMDLDEAKKIADLCFDLGINRIILIGGEPTLWEPIFDFCKYVTSKKIKVSLITNGVLLEDKAYVQKLKDSSVDTVNISLKGATREKFIDTAGVDKLDAVISGIKNLVELGIQVNVSMVITLNNIETLSAGVAAAIMAGAKHVQFDLCHNCDFTDNPNNNHLEKNNPYLLIEKFQAVYNEINLASDGKFSLVQTLPLCIWPKKLISKMNKRGQLNSICYVLQQNGIVFDSESNVIPCNTMHEIKIGKFGHDFKTAQEFCTFMQKQEIIEAYDRITSVPHERCLVCKDYANCGGGCVVQWTNYDFEKLLSMKLDDVEIVSTTGDLASQYVPFQDRVYKISHKNFYSKEYLDNRAKTCKQRINEFPMQYMDGKGGYIRLTATVKGKIIGTINCGYSHDEHYRKLGYAEFTDILIDPEYQRHGLGKRLFDAVVARLKEQGEYKNFVIGVHEDNVNARRAYEKWGGKLDTYTRIFDDMGLHFPEVYYLFEV